jgi:nucleoside-diphosphate-sugar epimerase
MTSVFDISPYYLKKAQSLKGPIIILGAGGFIGFNLFNSLLTSRSDVFAISSNPENNWRFNLLKPTQNNLLKTDLCKIRQLKSLIKTLKPKTVFNLAAYGAYSHQDNVQKIYQTNLLSSINLLEELKPLNVSAYIYAGSSSEYGYNCKKPSENDNLEPNSHYAVSKIASYYALKYFAKTFKFPAVHLRLYSVYGPFEEPTRLIPNLIQKCRHKTFPPFVDPDITRDFIYISDITSAFIAAASQAGSIKGEVFNIGSGIKTSIKELAGITKKIGHLKEKPVFKNMSNRSWDLKDWYANPAKAIETLKWKPEISLETGLKKTLAWQNQVDYDFKVLKLKK